MKREGHLYLLIGLIVTILVSFQFNPFKEGTGQPVSKVKKIDNFRQLMVNVKCNIYFIKGEEQGIVYEGPARLVNNINIDINKEVVTINKTNTNFRDFLFGWLYPSAGKRLNIYIVVHDLNALETGGKAKISIPPNSRNMQVVYSVDKGYRIFQL